MAFLGRGIRLFRAFGVTVQLDYSWFIFFILVSWTFGHFYFPHYYGDLPRVTLWTSAVTATILLFASVLFHEMSHAITSNRLGFPIKRITLFIFGGVAHMKSEPDNPRTEFAVAAAGPVSSLFLWLAFFGVAIAARIANAPEVAAVAEVLAEVNLVLALFNLVPGFPLDGGRLLRSAIWWKTNNLRRATNIAAKLGEGFAYLLMLVGALNFFVGRSGWINGLWYILVGVFLKGAAEQSYRHVLLEEVLQGIRVGDIMGQNRLAVTEDENLLHLVEEKFLHHKFTSYPVLNSEGYVVGLIDLKDIKGVPKEQRDAKAVTEVMRLIPLAHLPRTDTTAFDALREMLTLGVANLPVVDGDGRLAGIVTRADIMSMFQIRSDLADEIVV
jgi:Zn-dependent protease/CBS domain-containing protein